MSTQLTETARTSPPRIRGDIQGLRALAVLIVIGDHLWGWPVGGFVGVDIFFVISGYLITDLLLREHNRTGKISFTGFYRRRIKRILPAAALTLGVTLVVSWFVFNSARFSSIATDALWSILFAANWRYVAVGTDYFQELAPPSPLQHYWSLAVEEQFYIVWPWLLLLLLAALHRARASRAWIFTVLTLIMCASLIWAVWETASAPTTAYFSTLSRVWELAAGAALAIAAPLLARMPRQVRPIISWVGLIGIAVAVTVINETSGFPAPAAILPVLATAAVIAAGIGRTESTGPGVLTNRVSTYLGDVSYSLYLWHWPVIVIGTAILVEVGPIQQLSLLVIIFAVSILSYHLVENPLRTTQWRSRTWLRPAQWRVPRARWLMAGVAVALVPLLTAAAGATAWHNTSAMASEPLRLEAGTPPELAELQNELWLATAAAEWPSNLTPTVDQVILGPQAPPEIARCGMKYSNVDEALCGWGEDDAPRTAIVLGDSTAMGYVAPIRQIVDTNPEWKVYSYGTFGCGYVVIGDGQGTERCPERRQAAVDAVIRLQPDVVFITNRYGLWRDGSGTMTAEERADAVERFIDLWGDAAGLVVVVAPPPADLAMADCYTRISIPADCTNVIDTDRRANAAAEQAMIEGRGGQFVDSELWFCTQGHCPPFAGQIPTRRDVNHASPAYQERIGPVVLEDLTRRGIF